MSNPALSFHTYRRALVGIGLGAGLFVLALPGMAAPSEGTAGQTVTGRSLHRPDGSSHASTHVAAAPTHSKPAWQDLSPTQQQALRPLASHWDRLTEERKRKWLVISKNYATLSSGEQIKLHQRMNEWAMLSQQQRKQARQNFTEIKKLSPEQKASEWEAYQALSPAEKRKLATQAPVKPAGVATGKPGTAQPKLTSVPRRVTAPGPRMAEIGLPVQPAHSLLPQQESQRKDIERSPYEDDPAE